MKLLIIGDGRHGKDTVAEMLSVLGMTFVSSSHWCLKKAIWPHCDGVTLPKYDTLEEAYEDRVNWRDTWSHLISEYNDPKDRLVNEIFEDHDIYVGLRRRDEFNAARARFDDVIWVDRSQHLPPEPSNELTIEDATMVVNNNGGMYDLSKRVRELHETLCWKHRNTYR